MFDIGWSEIVVVAVVALVVIGPKELPGALRAVGGGLTRLRRMAGEFQGQFQQALKEAELDGVQQEIKSVASVMKGSFNPADLVRKEIGGALTGIGSPAAPAAASAAATPAVAKVAAPTAATVATTAAVTAAPAPPEPIPSAYAPLARFRKS